MNELVSIVVPCYKTAATVGETIDSLLKQTYSNIEIIISNDGSPDNTDEVVAPYLEKYKNIIYHKQENKGASSARNNGAKLSSGKYLMFLDSDDMLAPTYVEKCTDVLEAQPNVKLAYTNGWMFGAVKKKWKFTEYNYREFLMMTTIHSAALMRREDFFKAGMFDEELVIYEDWDLWIKILKDGGDVVLIKELLFYYRKREDKTSLTDYREGKPEVERMYRQRVYDKHKDLYLKNFGTEIDMIEEICAQYRAIERYKRKASKWYRKLFRF